MKNRFVFLMAPMSRIGSAFGDKVAQACNHPIAAVDDERSSNTIHGITRWTSTQFLEQAKQYPDAIAIDFSASPQGRDWVEKLCKEAGISHLNFLDAQAELGLSIDTAQYDIFLEDNPLSIYKHTVSAINTKTHEILRLLRYTGQEALRKHPNPLSRHAAKVYSQNEEDGITFEILRRLELQEGVFAEYGVGDGTENNTLSLLASNWRGFWIGNQDLAFPVTREPETGFYYSKEWVTRDNITELYSAGLKAIGEYACNLVSMDLDGNDWHFVKALLDSGIQPHVFITEYNAKFIPPIKFVIPYNDHHEWLGDDYFGASFVSFVDLFSEYGYFPVCCNITGSNAFFVHKKYKHLFQDIPEKIEEIFVAPQYFLSGLDYSGHPISLKTISSIVNGH
ncbi:hypothetical protein LG202_21830 [Methylobacillus methanolivorans]